MALDYFFTHPLLAPLWEKFAHLPPLLRHWDGQTLGQIAAEFVQPGTKPSVSAAFLDAVMTMTTPLLGQETALALKNRLASCPAVLSANYHCVECFPEMVQALHFFGLHDLCAPGAELRIIPVLSCGSVSLQSPTYPRGLSLSRHVHGHALHLPFFPSAFQDVMVCQAPALNENMLQAMRQKWSKGEYPLCHWEQEAVDTIVDTHILRPDILDQSRFCQQVSRINASLCAARYPEAKQVRVVYLEMESLVARLLGTSLGDDQSLMYRIFFDANLRPHILDHLAGVRGCWKTAAVNGPVLGRTGSAGTVFFWLADHKGRRCPLRLTTSDSEAVLEYKDTQIPLQPQDLCQALSTGQLIPSLFTVYTSLTLEHELRCYGGIFLADYLPAMIKGVLAACAQAGAPISTWTEHNPLAALPLTVQLNTADGLVPAGSVELMAAGGLTRAHLHSMATLSIAHVLPASLVSWYQEYIPMDQRPAGWEKELASLAAYWQGVVVYPELGTR